VAIKAAMNRGDLNKELSILLDTVPVEERPVVDTPEFQDPH
jgi:hypothetical protein